jgi:hypothetical protein
MRCGAKHFNWLIRSERDEISNVDVGDKKDNLIAGEVKLIILTDMV